MKLTNMALMLVVVGCAAVAGELKSVSVVSVRRDPLDARRVVVRVKEIPDAEQSFEAADTNELAAAVAAWVKERQAMPPPEQPAGPCDLARLKALEGREVSVAP